MKYGILYLALCLLIIVPPGAGPVQEAPAAAPSSFLWYVVSVDAPCTFSDMGPRSLGLDTAGRPHIAYGEQHLYHAWYDGTT
jgi:hypothetical protein